MKVNLYHGLDYNTPNNIEREKISLSILIQDNRTGKIIQIFQKEVDLSESVFDKMLPHQKIQHINTMLENFHLECIWKVLKKMDNEGTRFNLDQFTGSRIWKHEYFTAYSHINYGFYDYLKRFEDE